MGSRAERFILVDRDGVINRRVINGHITSWRQFEFLPRALEALHLLAKNGFITLVISHQPGIAEGAMTAHQLLSLTRRFLLEVRLAGGNIGKVYYCTHRAGSGCHCKTPQPGLLFRARADHHFFPAETYMVSERLNDLAAAAAIGCPGVLVRRNPFFSEEHDGSHRVATTLYDAVERCLSAGEQRFLSDGPPLQHQREPLLRQ